MCKNCMSSHFILGILVIVFAFWQTAASQWILLAIGVLMIIHSLGCSSCKVQEKPKAKSRKKKKK
jgi:hypothetical protein